MKKTLIILVLILGLISCRMQFFDEDGFTIFGYGAVVEGDEILIQSHDGFIVNDKLYNEVKVNGEVLVINPLDHDINVRFKYKNIKEWIIIKDEYYINIEDE